MVQCFHVCTGTKNVAKMLKKVSVGTVAQRGKTWFPELSDKSMSHEHHKSVYEHLNAQGKALRCTCIGA